MKTIIAIVSLFFNLSLWAGTALLCYRCYIEAKSKTMQNLSDELLPHGRKLVRHLVRVVFFVLPAVGIKLAMMVANKAIRVVSSAVVSVFDVEENRKRAVSATDINHIVEDDGEMDGDATSVAD